MQNPWAFLALMFWMRATMAFQYQAIAALSNQTMESVGLNLADIGILIGVYSIPGILLAIPGARIGQILGRKSAISLGQVLMLTGGLIITFGDIFELQLTGRICAGVGAIILNVLATEIVSRRFKDCHLSTALALFINSWPVGIATALFILPQLAEYFGLFGANIFVCLLVLINIVIFGLLVEDGQSSQTSDHSGSAKDTGQIFLPVLIAALIWGCYNSSLAMIFSFTPAILGELQFSAERAGALTSLIMLVVTLTVPLGGIISDRFCGPYRVIVPGLVLFSILLAIAPSFLNLPVLILLGISAGILVGPIISLPARIDEASDNTPDMGFYFTVYYIFIVTTPIMAGILADLFQTAQATYYFGSLMLIICLPLIYGFHRSVKHFRKAVKIRPKAGPQVHGLQAS